MIRRSQYEQPNTSQSGDVLGRFSRAALLGAEALSLTLLPSLALAGCNSKPAFSSVETIQTVEPTPLHGVESVHSDPHDTELYNKADHKPGQFPPQNAAEWLQRVDYLTDQLRAPEGAPGRMILVKKDGSRVVDGQITPIDHFVDGQIVPDQNQIGLYAPAVRGDKLGVEGKGNNDTLTIWGHVRYGTKIVKKTTVEEIQDVFSHLDEAVPGDRILVKTTADEVAVYTIDDLADYSSEELPQQTRVWQTPDPDAPAAMSLITCVNTGSKTSSAFTERHVVFASFTGSLNKKFSNDIFNGILTGKNNSKKVVSLVGAKQ